MGNPREPMSFLETNDHIYVGGTLCWPCLLGNVAEHVEREQAGEKPAPQKLVRAIVIVRGTGLCHACARDRRRDEIEAWAYTVEQEAERRVSESSDG